MIAPVDILVVHARREDLLALVEALTPLGERITPAATMADALHAVHGLDLAAAVVDLDGNAADAFSLVELLRGETRPGTPVVFVSAEIPDDTTLRRVHTLGSADLVTLPAPPEALRSKVALFAELQRLRELAEARTGPEPRTTSLAAVDPAERMRLLTEAVSDYALFFADPNGLISDWTASAEHLFGYSAAEVVGQPIAIIFTAEDQALGAPDTELRQATATGQALDERMHVRKDGSAFPTTGRLIALREPRSGDLRGFAKIVWDATQLRVLEENERKFREIFETANEGIWILDRDARIQAVNQRMAEIMGYTIAEMLGRQKNDFTFPEDAAYVNRLFAERAAGKIASSVDVRFRRKDGSPIATLLSARPMYRAGRFVGALDMFTDVTERRVAETRFRLFFESSAAGHALIDPASQRFIAVNRRLAEIAGRPVEEVEHLSTGDLTHPEDRELDRHVLGRLWSGEVSEAATEKRYVRPDGSVVWVSLTSTVVRDAHGVPNLQLSVIHDITSRRNTEIQLEENRTRLRLAIEAADLGVFYHDGATGRDTWNDHAKLLLELPTDAEPSYQAFLEHVHPEDRDRVQQVLAPYFKAGAPDREFGFECRVITGQGNTRYIAANGATEPAKQDGTGGLSIIGTVRDISASKQFELELQQQVERRTHELREKTSQLEAFTYTVAHDLRAPLRAINGYADIIGGDLGALAPPAVQDYLERIKSSTRRLDQLIRDLLAYSRITEVGLVLDRVDLGAAMRTALHELESEIARRGAVISMPDRFPVVWGEQSMVEQVFVNLLSNAVKFTPPRQAPHIEIALTVHDSAVRVEVRDAGIGIPEEYHRRIFKVFERLQAARDYPGTGIGLAIVAKAMQRLGGNYGVISRPGHGSTFWIEFHRVHP